MKTVQILFPYLGYEVDWEETSNSVQCLHTLSHASLEEKVSNWKLVSNGISARCPYFNHLHPTISTICGIQCVILAFFMDLLQCLLIHSFLHHVPHPSLVEVYPLIMLVYDLPLSSLLPFSLKSHVSRGTPLVLF